MSLKREKTIVLALLIQLIIAAFSSFLVVGLTSLYDPGSIESDELTVGVTGDHQNELVAAANEADGVGVERYESRQKAIAAFDRGQTDAVLSANAVQADGSQRVEVRATAPAQSIRTTLVVVQLREILGALEHTERKQRFTTGEINYRPIDQPTEVNASPYFGFTYTILIPLLLFLPPFISGSVAVDALTEEIERGTLELVRVAPVSLVDIVEGKAAAMILLAPLQVLLWLGLLSMNNIAVSNVLELLVFVTAITTITVLLGLVLGLLTRKRRRAQLLYSVLVIVLFGATAVFPEHPATTIAKLAVASETLLTLSHVVGFALLAIAAFVGVRNYVTQLDPESL